MRFAFGILAFVAGLALGSLAIHVAFFGAEPPLPPEGEAIEGTLLGGTTLESPIGRPFLYGQVKLTEQRGSRLGVDEWRGVFGDPVVKVQTERGVEAVELGHPSEWRVLPEFDETATLTTLRGVPLLDEVDVGEREAPFQVSVRAAREGDPIVVERGGRKARVFLGERGPHEQLHAARESGRYPVVLLLAVMSAVSIFGATRLFRAAPHED
ncbi:MAG: hypothetical protein GXY23_00795 [Myxococcales bacterium]|nr:hypothetical protein [Myxococcales bacterium]